MLQRPTPRSGPLPTALNMKVSVAKACPALCNPLDGMQPARCWSGCHALLWGVFPTQRSSPCLLHTRYLGCVLWPLIKSQTSDDMLRCS